MNVGIKQRILQLQAKAGLGGSGGGGGGWSGHRHGMAEVNGWGAAERGGEYQNRFLASISVTQIQR